jgi:hypothetical protein
MTFTDILKIGVALLRRSVSLHGTQEIYTNMSNVAKKRRAIVWFRIPIWRGSS